MFSHAATAWQPERVTTSAAALRTAAALGPYFAVALTADLTADGPGWLPLAALVDDPVRLRERVATARSVLAGRCGLAPDAIEERATASIHFPGLAARVISPAFGAAVLTGTVPVLGTGGVHWQPVDGGPIPLAVTAPQARWAPTLDGLADLMYADVVSMTAEPLAEAVHREFRLSPKVLWGNIASAVAGAAAALAVTRPDLGRRSTALADRLLQRGRLAGTGRFLSTDPTPPERFFRRRSCCLFYRVPGGGTCADCVLNEITAPRPVTPRRE